MRSMALAAVSVTLAVLLAVSAPPGSAMAQMVCGDRDKILKQLADGYAEAPIAMGVASNGKILEVLASVTGSWTIIMTSPTGLSCAILVGEAWEAIAPPPLPGDAT